MASHRRMGASGSTSGIDGATSDAIQAQLVKKEDNELLRPGYVRVSLPYFADEAAVVRSATVSTPFSMGIANQLGLTPSAFHFRGVQLAEGVTLEESRPQRRQITFIGASDTAGFCAKIALIYV